jgi:hypothetical protein
MVLLLAGAGLVAGCGGGSPSATHTASAVAAASSPTAASQVTDPAGQACDSLDSTGYCPGDDPQATDPNGQTCASLDQAGYCPGDDPLTCDTVIDPTGWANGPLTEVRAIAIAAAVSDTDFVGIIEGTLTDTEMHLLNDAATELNQGSGSSDQLGQDSTQFANDESSYANNNGDTGPQDTAYGEPMTKDIIVLVKDCPHAYKLGKEMAGQG